MLTQVDFGYFFVLFFIFLQFNPLILSYLGIGLHNCFICFLWGYHSFMTQATSYAG
jgi:hypothetical protein